MRKLLFVIVMTLLTTFVLQATVRIEVLNISAGNYLPRSDSNPDGTFADGKWRVSPENTPRDRLRALVQTYGLMQYIFAPLLLILATVAFLKATRSWARAAATFSLLVAGLAISLMIHREYYQSLGW